MPAAPATTLRLATRGSALARAQTELAAGALLFAGVAVVTPVVLRTHGDRHARTPLEELVGQGWFTAELERALLDGRADVAVHSAKDLPTSLAEGLAVAAHLRRADPRDGLVTRDRGGIDDLPAGATVGTSSARRAGLLAALHPRLRPVAVRGNIGTRLRKLDAGEFDALLLACAGLDRLGLGDRVAERLDPADFVPSPAQGAIALQALAGSAAARACAAVDDRDTSTTVAAERAVLAGLGGGCLLPLGAWARLEAGSLALCAALAEGGEVRRAEARGDAAAPAALGARVAAMLA